MRKVNVSGKIIKVFPVRVFKTQKNGDGKVSNFILADETSNIKVVLWDVHHIEMIEKGEISEDSVVEIKNCSMRENEIHLGSFSELKKSKEIFEKVEKNKIIKEKQISEFKIGDSVSVRAFIVQSFEPKFFEVNKETGRKIKEEEKFEGVTKERRALINLVIDDGTGTIRAVLFHENLKEIGLNDLEDVEKTISQREDLLGKEFIFLGTVRKNNFFNNEEFVVDSVKKINLDELINNFEKK
jgi:ssDNA-binding replication factor A large subunit